MVSSVTRDLISSENKAVKCKQMLNANKMAEWSNFRFEGISLGLMVNANKRMCNLGLLETHRIRLTWKWFDFVMDVKKNKIIFVKPILRGDRHANFECRQSGTWHSLSFTPHAVSHSLPLPFRPQRCPVRDRIGLDAFQGYDLMNIGIRRHSTAIRREAHSSVSSHSWHDVCQQKQEKTSVCPCSHSSLLNTLIWRNMPNVRRILHFMQNLFSTKRLELSWPRSATLQITDAFTRFCATSWESWLMTGIRIRQLNITFRNNSG